MADNITINIVDNPTNVSVGLSTTPDIINVDALMGGGIWGSITGLLSTQTDLWSQLSAKALSSQIVPTITDYLSTNPILIESLDTRFEILSAGVNLFDIFITSAEESQTLSYDPATYNLSISLGNTVNLSSILLSPNVNAVFQTLSTQSVTTGDLNASGNVDIQGTLDVQTEILSANIPLHDIFLTSETDSQTLSYNVTGENLSISSGNTVNLSALSYRNIEDPTSTLLTIEQFANSYSGSIHPGYDVTLYNGRVYTFAGTDKNNPSHYLEVNANPYLPIYREVALSGDQTAVIDSFFLGDFKTAKYSLQIETSFNNESYYSEINVKGSVQTSTGVATEYGLIFTDQLILGYDVSVSFNNLEFIILYNADMAPGRKLIIKGHRTNFYKI
jgi:hypothetical protein